VPTEVAIDEAVTLAKRYATEEAGRLVNGILGQIAREQEAAAAAAPVVHGRPSEPTGEDTR
jgi:N utilization substance protein B